MRIRSLAALLLTFALAPALSWAAVPPDIAGQLKEMGRVVNPAGTAKLYRPLQPKAPYPGVKVEHDISYGPDARNVLDVFAPEKGGGSRPVLIYVAGGAGNKIEPVPDGDAFYDNIMLWAVKNGMTGVNVQRRGGQGLEWDDPAKDIGRLIGWVQQNISRYKGNPNRVFIWAHSAGNGPVSTYIGHPELYGPNGVGLKGAILMSGNFNILPVTVTVSPGQEGAAKGGGGKGRGGAPPVDPAVQLTRSNLPGILKSKVAFFMAAAELDPPNTVAFSQTVKEQLCMAGHCPAAAVFKDHSHMSEVFSPNTADDTVSSPILKWIKSVK
ncbi:MAG: putative esterase/lipase [Bryobacterales bacterium]|nr:putative esterase/lipase [Bryobacterales bacterium]